MSIKFVMYLAFISDIKQINIIETETFIKVLFFAIKAY